MDLVSVVIPTYNARSMIDRAIQSVLSQTYKTWELIIVDDASTDNTVEWIRERYGQIPQLQVFVSDVNSGPSETRNVAMQHATGEWIALLDSDDAWHELRLEHLCAAAKGCDFIADNLVAYDAVAGVETGPLFESFDASTLTLDDLLSGRVGRRRLDGGYLKPLMRTDYMRGKGLCYNTTLRQGEDFLLYCEALCKGARFRLIDTYGYIYTTGIGHASKQQSPHSQTRPDPVAMSKAVHALHVQYGTMMPETTEQSLLRFSENLRKNAPWWEFETASQNRRWLQCTLLLLRHRIVLRQLLKSIILRTGFWPTDRRGL